MTERQARAFVEKWAAVIAPEWRLEVETGWASSRSPDEVVSSIHTSSDYLAATLYLGATVGPGDSRGQRQTLLHELIHLALHDLASLAERLAGDLGVQASIGARREVDHHLERATERLAWALVDAGALDG